MRSDNIRTMFGRPSDSSWNLGWYCIKDVVGCSRYTQLPSPTAIRKSNMTRDTIAFALLVRREGVPSITTGQRWVVPRHIQTQDEQTIPNQCHSYVEIDRAPFACSRLAAIDIDWFDLCMSCPSYHEDCCYILGRGAQFRVYLKKTSLNHTKLAGSSCSNKAIACA